MGSKTFQFLAISCVFFLYNGVWLAGSRDFSDPWQIVAIPLVWSVLSLYLIENRHTYTAINSFLVFLISVLAEKLTFDSLGGPQALAYSVLFIAITFISVWCYQEFNAVGRKSTATLLCGLFYFAISSIPLLFVIFSLSHKTKVTNDVLYAVFQTNSLEAADYMLDFVGQKWIAAYLFITLAIWFFFWKQGRTEPQMLQRKKLLILTGASVIVAVYMHGNLRLVNFTFQGLQAYQQELNLFREVQNKRKAMDNHPQAKKAEQGETYVVVIGESLNKKHMEIYGYLRMTTPNLSKAASDGDLLVFRNVYSPHTHTDPVLSLSLTEANLVNGKNYFDSLSIIDVLKEAGVETYWLTNQSLKGAWGNTISVIATEADHLLGVNHSIGETNTAQHYDGFLIKELEKILSRKTASNRVVFIHLMGSHWRYSRRYPEAYNVFNRAITKGDFGSRAEVDVIGKVVNWYDNSIRYNDSVVASMLKSLQERSGVAGFLYVADHADDVLGLVGHESTQFTYNMVQIPMFAWFSDQYRLRYPKRYTVFKSQVDALYSNGFLYDTLLGLIDVKTTHYDAQFDLSSNDYHLDPEKTFILHGEKTYTDEDNYLWWQEQNTRYLVDTHQAARVFPHRVNSTGKLKDVWAAGFRSFEVDVRWSNDNNGCLLVGHGDADSGGTLENFLETVNYSGIQRLWLDLKNLNKNNYESVLARLAYLDKKFSLKEKCIVESGTTSSFFSLVSDSGWHSSYYLPTDYTLDLLKKQDVNGMRQLAEKIARQGKVQKVCAVSFDNRLYEFVKKYLEQLLEPDVVYHAWYGPGIYEKTFPEKLAENPLFVDSRVKTILVPFKSQFHL